MEQACLALRQCPFLHKVASQHGEEYAKNLAICPTASAACGPPVGSDHAQLYAESFQLFHGPQGIVPLVESSSRGAGCPFHAQALAKQPKNGEACEKPKPVPPHAPPLATISFSLGSGPNFGDFFRNKLKHNNSNNRPKSSQGPGHGRPPNHPAAGGSGTASSNAGPAGNSGQHPASNLNSGSSNGFRPQRPLTDSAFGNSAGNTAGSSHGNGFSGPSGGHAPQPPSATSGSAAGCMSTSSTSHTVPANGTNSSSISSPHISGNSGWSAMSSSTGVGNTPNSATSPAVGGWGQPAASNRVQPPGRNSGHNGTGSLPSSRRLSGAGQGGGTPGGNPVNGSACPLRKWLGPMAGLVFNQYDKLVCPPPIVAARAALAQTAAVQQLRPQALPVKLVAVAAVAAAANLPCGAVREHFEKFSTGWFIAVHATIPFVAMLRKAVIMPKYAIVVTIAAAVLGQMVGSRLERLRLQQLTAAQLQSQVVPAALPAPATVGRHGGNGSRNGKGQEAGRVLEAQQASGRCGVWQGKGVSSSASASAGKQEEQEPTPMWTGCGAGLVTGLGSLLPQLPVVLV